MMGMSPEVIDWFVKRGCTVDDAYLLIPHTCQHLQEERIPIMDLGTQIGEKVFCTCDIHYKDEFPIICRRFHGHGRYYIPNGCVYYNEDVEKEQRRIVEDAEFKLSRKYKKKETQKDLEVS
jgi:hypothetical protein